MGFKFVVAFAAVIATVVLLESSDDRRAWLGKALMMISYLVFFLLVRLVPALFDASQHYGYECTGYILTLIVLVACIIVLRKNPSARASSRQVFLALFSVMLCWFLFEEAFAMVFVQTDGFGYTSAAKAWRARYWKPLNSLGYRDSEHPATDFYRKKTLFVVGDSFVAGYGIKDAKDRFSDVLQDRLGKQWLVANVAQPGWDTLDELQAVRSHPHNPQMILLSYFINDIEGACTKSGYERPPSVDLPSPFIDAFTQDSRLAGFLYWRCYRRWHAGPLDNKYWSFMKGCYDNSRVWDRHRREISSFIRYANHRRIRLMVVIFPSLTDVEGTRPYTAKVAGFFRENGVPVVDLTPLFSGRKPSDMIVNNFDAHPNVATHRQVAETLLPLIRGREQGKPIR